MNKLIPDIEKASKEEIKKFQENLLKQNLPYLNKKSKYYSELFQQEKINIGKIKNLEDLRYIPPTTKEDLQQRNRDFICVSKDEIIDYVTTSGSMGEPVIFVLTDNDLERLAYNEAISFACAEGSANDVYQLMTTIDKRFMAGLAYFIGVRKLGAGIIRVGNGIPQLQWDSIARFSPNAIITVPSFILKIIEYAEENGIDYRNSSVKKAVCIGEPLREPDFSLNLLGNRIKEKWDINLFSTYASTEMSTAFTECSEHTGCHHHPELIIAEFLDENDNSAGDDEAGELTITTLGVEGMPLLRFKTGDMCRHYNDKCKCGRNTMKLGPIIGRKNQMIKYKGTTLFPPAIFDVLDHISGIENYVVEINTDRIGTDDILIHIGIKESTDHSQQSTEEGILRMEKMVKDNFRAKLRVTPQILIKSEEEINKIQSPEINRKPRKFIDNRKW